VRNYTVRNYYERLSAKGTREGLCRVRGKPAKRTQTFSQTVNPWNKHPEEDRPKTRHEVWKSVLEQAQAWASGGRPVHQKCEKEEA